MKKYLAVAAALVASAAAAKPPLPEAFYESMSTDWVTLHACGQSGKMAPETAVLGIGYMKQMLAQYEVDQGRMNGLVKRAGDEDMAVITSRCNALAMKVLEVKQAQQQAAQDAQEQRAARQRFVNQMQQWGQQMQQMGREALQDSPQTTNCRRTFTGVSCTTY